MRLSALNKKNRKDITDPEENVYLSNCIFGDHYSREIKEINKHEIIVRIAEMLGPSPCELGKAEKIFNQMKYNIANYIIHHEYNSSKGVSTELLTWLDSQSNPDKSRKLNKFISKFIK